MLGNLVRAGELARAARADADVEARFFLDAFLAWLAEHPTACSGGVVGEVGCLLFDAHGSQQAFVARFGIEPCPAGTGGPLLPAGCGAELHQAVIDAELAVLRLLAGRHRLEPRRALLEGKRFYLRGPRATEAFVKDGGSIGAAAAVVLFSLWNDLPVPPGILLTGCIGPGGAVGKVSHTTAKVHAALREQPSSRLVIVPAEGMDLEAEDDADERVEGVATLEALLERLFGSSALELQPVAAVDIEGTVRKGIELYEKLNSYRAAEEVLGLALAAITARREAAGDPTLHRPEEFACRWRVGSALVHQGRVEQADRALGDARRLGEALWQAEELDPRDYLGLLGSLAVLLRDRYRYDEAEVLLLETLELQRQLRQGKRERAKTLGNLGELWTITGAYQRAEEVLERCRAHLEATYPDEVPRALCYLGNLARHRGDLDQAIARYGEGLAANTPVQYGRAANEAFLRYGLVRALGRAGRHGEAIEQADLTLAELPVHAPYPRQLLLMHRGLAAIAAGDEGRGRADLHAAADLTHVRGSLLRFGVTTALGQLALHLLAADPTAQREQVARYALSLLDAARAVPGLDEGERAGLLGELEATFGGAAVVGEPRRATLLRQLIALFPY